MNNKDLVFEVCCFSRLATARNLLQTNKELHSYYNKSFWSDILSRNLDKNTFYDIFSREGGNNLNEIEVYVDILMTKPQICQDMFVTSMIEDLINSYNLSFSINEGVVCERYTSLIRKFLFLFSQVFNDIRHIILSSTSCLLSGITQEATNYISKRENADINMNEIKWSICSKLPHVLFNSSLNTKEILLAYGIDIPIFDSNFLSMMQTCTSKYTTENIDGYIYLTDGKFTQKKYTLKSMTEQTKISTHNNKIDQLLQEEALKIYLKRTGSRKVNLNIESYTTFIDTVMQNYDHDLFSYLVRNRCNPTLHNVKNFLSRIQNAFLPDISWFKILKLSLEEVCIPKNDRRNLLRYILRFLEKLLKLHLQKKERKVVVDIVINFLNRIDNNPEYNLLSSSLKGYL